MISAAKFKDLRRFGGLLMKTRDNDPIYPLLREIIALKKLNREQALWLIYLYLCFYNTSSAWAAFKEFPEPGSWFSLDELTKWERTHRDRLAINIERRGLRGGKVVQAIESFATQIRPGTQEQWLTASLDRLKGEDWVSLSPNAPFAAPFDNYNILWDRTQTVFQVGRWAAFKWLDLLQHVADFPIAAPDMRMQFCSGPRQALEELYFGERSSRQDPAYIDELNKIGADLRGQLAATGLSLQWDELETVLCNFHSMDHGRYYVGHDWDEHLEDTLRGGWDVELWMRARERAAPSPDILGEIPDLTVRGGPRWTGIRKHLMGAYKQRGVIYCDV